MVIKNQRKSKATDAVTAKTFFKFIFLSTKLKFLSVCVQNRIAVRISGRKVSS